MGVLDQIEAGLTGGAGGRKASKQAAKDATSSTASFVRTLGNTPPPSNLDPPRLQAKRSATLQAEADADVFEEASEETVFTPLNVGIAALALGAIVWVSS